MRWHRWFIVSSIAGALLTLPGTASAGGWWSYLQLERDHVVPGESVVGRDQVWFPSVTRAERLADPATSTPYFIYLVPGFDPGTIDYGRAEPYDWVELGTMPRFQVGEVRFATRDANLLTISARITVPASLDPGTYWLLVCDAGCRRPLGSTIASSIRVWAHADTARLANELDEARDLLNVRRSALWQARAATGRAERALEDAVAHVRSLEGRVAELERQLESRSGTALGPPPAAPVPTPAPATSRPWTTAMWSLAGAVAGAVATALAVRRRRRLAEPPIDAWREAERARTVDEG